MKGRTASTVHRPVDYEELAAVLATLHSVTARVEAILEDKPAAQRWLSTSDAAAIACVGSEQTVRNWCRRSAFVFVTCGRWTPSSSKGSSTIAAVRGFANFAPNWRAPNRASVVPSGACRRRKTIMRAAPPRRVSAPRSRHTNDCTRYAVNSASSATCSIV
jgi:hypothetical protein